MFRARKMGVPNLVFELNRPQSMPTELAVACTHRGRSGQSRRQQLSAAAARIFGSSRASAGGTLSTQLAARDRGPMRRTYAREHRPESALDQMPSGPVVHLFSELPGSPVWLQRADLLTVS